MKTKKLILLAIFAAIALIIHIIEAQMPLPIPVPGVKLGLANTVTLFMLFMPKHAVTSISRHESDSQLGIGYRKTEHNLNTNTGKAGGVFDCTFTTTDVLIVLFCRIVLGALLTGRLLAFAYSLAGGVLAITAQIAARRFVTEKQAWVCGAIGAAAHNIGQILAAMIITGTPSIIAYLPALIIAGIITGALTGLIAGWTARRLK